MRSKKETVQQQFLKFVKISDERGRQKVCSLCMKEFSIITGEHQCKRCKRAVCEKCSPNKAVALNFDKDVTKQHRQCNFCKDESMHIKQFVQDNHLVFNRDTISKQWLQAFNVSLEDSVKDYKQARQEISGQSDTSEFMMFKGQQGKVFDELQTSLNYSISEFFSLMMNGNNRDVIKNLVEEVLDTFLRKHPEVGYQPEIVVMVLFLLCFGSVQSAYTLLTIIYACIIPPYLYNRAMRLKPYDFKNEVDQIVSINEKLNRETLQPFVQKQIYRYILTLSLNFFMFETSFLIWSEMLSDQKLGYQNLIKTISMAINFSSDEQKKYSTTDIDGIELYLLRNTRANKISNQIMLTKNINITKINAQNQDNNSLRISTRISKQVEDTQNKLENELKQLKKDYRESQILAKDQGQQIDHLKEQLENQQKQTQSLQDELLELKDTQEKNYVQSILLQEENVKLKTQLQQNKNNLSQLDQNENKQQYTKQEVESIYLNLSQVTEEKDRLQINIQQIQQENDANLKKIQKLEQNIIDQNKAISSHQIQFTLLQDQLNQKDLQIQKIKQQSEIAQNNNNNTNDSNSSELGNLLISKNDEINDLTEKLMNQQKVLVNQDKVILDLKVQNDELQDQYNQTAIQLETHKSQNTDLPKYLIKIENLESNIKKKDIEIQEILKNENNQQLLLSNKNKEILEFKNNLIELKQQINNKEQIITDYKNQLTQMQQDIDANKYIVGKYGQSEILHDKSLNKDIEFIIQDLDSVKERLVLSLKESITNAQSQIRFKNLQCKSYQEEIQNTKSLLQEKIKQISQLDLDIKILQEQQDTKTQISNKTELQNRTKSLANMSYYNNRQSALTPLDPIKTNQNTDEEIIKKHQIIENNQIDDNNQTCQAACTIQ